MRRLYLLASLLSLSLSVHAVPVTYDFSGIGSVTIFTGVGADSNTTDTHFTGWVTMDIVSTTPPATANVDPAGDWAVALNGWVESQFFIDWGTGNFTTQPVPDQTSSEMRTIVYNAPYRDSLENFASYYSNVGTVRRDSLTYLSRQTNDPTWLDSLGFDPTAGLATGAGALNHLTFHNTSSDYVFNTWTGFYGDFELDSFAARPPVSVPEPGSMALFGVAMAATGFVRRRRVN
jgi:hypothetical protein